MEASLGYIPQESCSRLHTLNRASFQIILHVANPLLKNFPRSVITSCVIAAKSEEKCLQVGGGVEQLLAKKTLTI